MKLSLTCAIGLVAAFSFCVAQFSHVIGQEGRPIQRAQAAAVDQQAKSDEQKGAASDKKPNPDTQPLVQIRALISLLEPEQKSKAMMPFDSEKRVDWHFIPMATRKGLPLMEMTQPQQAQALKVLRSCLSQVGFEKAKKIMEMESLLKTIEGDKGQNERNPVKYYYTIFGEPAAKQRWGLSIEGHHLSLNFVLVGNRIVDSTPQFFAANPAVLKSKYEGFSKGLAVLKPEEQLAIELYSSLSESQRAKATLTGTIPTEIRAAGSPQPPQDKLQGISAKDLTETQQETLKKLLTAYTSKMKQPVAKGRWDLIDQAGWESVYFSWSGGTGEGQGRYYVVRGPTFLVEFINVQPDAAGNPANHIHCVWRDMTGDFDLTIN